MTIKFSKRQHCNIGIVHSIINNWITNDRTIEQATTSSSWSWSLILNCSSDNGGSMAPNFNSSNLETISSKIKASSSPSSSSNFAQPKEEPTSWFLLRRRRPSSEGGVSSGWHNSVAGNSGEEDDRNRARVCATNSPPPAKMVGFSESRSWRMDELGRRRTKRLLNHVDLLFKHWYVQFKTRAHKFTNFFLVKYKS